MRHTPTRHTHSRLSFFFSLLIFSFGFFRPISTDLLLYTFLMYVQYIIYTWYIYVCSFFYMFKIKITRSILNASIL